MTASDPFIPYVFLLKNKTVPRDPYYETFAAQGSAVRPEFLPLLQHEYIDPPGLKQELESTEFMAGSGPIIITSQRAIEAVNQHLPELNLNARDNLLCKPVYTVGPATAKVLKDAGFKDIRGGLEAGNGSVLADIILRDAAELSTQEHSSGMTFFTGETRRDIIPKKLAAAGINLREKVVYRTMPLGDIDVRVRKRVVDSVSSTNGKLWHYLVFFSPAEADPVADALINMKEDRKCHIAAIGPTTREYLEAKNLPVAVMAEKPDAFHLMKGIREHQESLLK